ncbi:hypothetical protein ACKVWE_001793 [Pyricularia oryzae]
MPPGFSASAHSLNRCLRASADTSMMAGSSTKIHLSLSAISGASEKEMDSWVLSSVKTFSKSHGL